MSEQTLVVMGAGGMGEAIARRLGAGRPVVLGDVDGGTLERTAASLEGDGFNNCTASPRSSRNSVARSPPAGRA